MERYKSVTNLSKNQLFYFFGFLFFRKPPFIIYLIDFSSFKFKKASENPTHYLSQWARLNISIESGVKKRFVNKIKRCASYYPPLVRGDFNTKALGGCRGLRLVLRNNFNFAILKFCVDLFLRAVIKLARD